MAVSHAVLILSWQENLPRDEMPPEWMWAHDDELEEWFDELSLKREARMSGHVDDDDDEIGMTRNDLSPRR